jgi:hypothetical protein
VDADGDGHLAIACGGDDCDDNDPTVYPGATEYFDGKDNDCNHLIDDQVAGVKGLTGGPLTLAGANVCNLGAAVGGGPGGYSCVATNVGNLESQAYSPAWARVGMVGKAAGINTGSPEGAASEIATMAFGSEINSVTYIVVLNASDGSLIGAANIGGGINIQQIAWTGEHYLFGGFPQGGAPGTSLFGLLDTSGNILGVQQLPASKAVTGVYVAGNGTSIAVGYTDAATSQLYLQTYTELGSPTTAMPVHIGSGTLLAVGAMPGAYAVLANTTTGAGVWVVPAPGGAASKPTSFATVDPDTSNPPTSATAASDGYGAAFLISYGGSSPSVSLGYQDGVNGNPFELHQIAANAGTANTPNITGGPGGRLGVFYVQGGQLFGRQAGVASLSGAFCAQSSNCASGMCTPVVASGPKAYSVCM